MQWRHAGGDADGTGVVDAEVVDGAVGTVVDAELLARTAFELVVELEAEGLVRVEASAAEGVEHELDVLGVVDVACVVDHREGCQVARHEVALPHCGQRDLVDGGEFGGQDVVVLVVGDDIVQPHGAAGGHVDEGPLRGAGEELVAAVADHAVVAEGDEAVVATRPGAEFDALEGVGQPVDVVEAAHDDPGAVLRQERLEAYAGGVAVIFGDLLTEAHSRPGVQPVVDVAQVGRYLDVLFVDQVVSCYLAVSLFTLLHSFGHFDAEDVHGVFEGVGHEGTEAQTEGAQVVVALA